MEMKTLYSVGGKELTMKTVQECLQELDIEELTDSYLAIPYIRREMTELMRKENTLTGKKIRNLFRNKIREYIGYMRTTPVEISEDPAILYVYEVLEGDTRDKYWHGLVYLSELKDKGVEAEDYSYTLCTHQQVAGFLVADTKLTQENLLALMTDVLYEASFSGYTEEDVAKEIRDFEEACKEVEADGKGAGEVAEDEFCEADHVKPEQERSEEELRLADAYSNARGEYSAFLRKKALRNVISALEKIKYNKINA